MSSPESGSNFYIGFFFLPKEKRRALSALYAFCRTVDDAVDFHPEGSEQARREVEFWKEELERLYAGRPSHPVAAGLLPFVERYRLDRQNFRHILDGVSMDLEKRRYPDFQGLLEYCYRVASAVGLLAIEIFGYAHPETKQYAENLGYAFQLTNILRDVATDAARGRIYIPLEDLRRFDIKEEEILSCSCDVRFPSLVNHEIHRAQRYYQKACEFLHPQDRKNMRPAEAMKAVYWEILKQIERNPCGIFSRRIRIPAWRKVLAVLGTAFGPRTA